MLLFLRSLFTFTLHLLPQGIPHWMGKRREKGLGQMSSHFRLHVCNHWLKRVWQDYFGKNSLLCNPETSLCIESLCCLPQQEGVIRVSASFTEEAVRSREERQVQIVLSLVLAWKIRLLEDQWLQIYKLYYTYYINIVEKLVSILSLCLFHDVVRLLVAWFALLVSSNVQQLTVKRSQLLLAVVLFSYCRKDSSDSKVSKKQSDEAKRERLASHGCENACYKLWEWHVMVVWFNFSVLKQTFCWFSVYEGWL